MKAVVRLWGCAGLVLSLLMTVSAERMPSRPMSLEDRLLLNRLILSGHSRIQVMLVCDPARLDSVLDTVGRIGGRAVLVERVVGYARVDVPIEQLATLATDPSVDAYHIASLAQAAWSRDGLSRANAEGAHAAQAPPAVRFDKATVDANLPILDRVTAQQAGYTADEDTHIDQWLRLHPTFDGRGVTIAIIENAQANFAHPVFGSALTLDGQPVNKLAGIINAMDPLLPDDTRVSLTTEVEAKSPWVPIANRTFILPHAGTYRFGYLSLNAGDNLIQQYGVLRSQTTGEIWVDTDGDADFSDEQPVVGLEHKFEVRSLKVTQPRKATVNFVVTADDARTVHVYADFNGHQDMTVSVAAGSRNDGVAFGVAPAARVMLVRGPVPIALRLSDFLEGMLAAAARPDVDILTTTYSLGLVPDTDAAFAGQFFHRLDLAYHKPVFVSVGNNSLRVSEARSLGPAFSVGGTISPTTFSALYGGGQLPSVQVHSLSGAGPARDGGLKPDFLAPMERISASLCTEGAVGLPKIKPTVRLPACYQVSCCSSASSPYGAGVAALLISAAKQGHVDYSVGNLGRALRASARFLPNVPAHLQGTGLVDVEAAWRELQRPGVDSHVTITGQSRHELTAYNPSGSTGPGVFETEGWTVGAEGTRKLLVRREAGATNPTAYRLSWTGNDGTFSAPPSIVLPLRETVPLTVSITPRTASAHSAILNVHDPATDAIVTRTLATVIVPERLDHADHAARFEGRVPLMQATHHFWEVLPGTNALDFEVHVTQGRVRVELVPAGVRQPRKYPSPDGRNLPAGTYRFVVPDPAPGTWSVTITNDSAFDESDIAAISTSEAQYTFAVRSWSASLTTASDANGHPVLIASNHGARLEEPQIKQSWGTITSSTTSFNAEGRVQPFEISVPKDASTLIVSGRMTSKPEAGGGSATGLDLYLYECTTGECFLHDFAFPAASEQKVVVRKPYAGRWVAIVGAPSFPATGSYAIDAIVVSGQGSHTVSLDRALAPGDRWTGPADLENAAPSGEAVRVYELFDEALQRRELQQPLIRKTDFNTINRPVAIAIAITKGSKASEDTFEVQGERPK